jgi:hypothetical protein
MPLPLLGAVRLPPTATAPNFLPLPVAAHHINSRHRYLPAHADMYAELAASHRTDAICVHAAVCATFRNVHWLSSVNVGGIVEFMSDAHKKEFHPDLKLEEVPMLPCVPLQFILDK